MPKVLGLISSYHKLDVIAFWEVEARRSEIQSYPWLRNVFEANLGYMRPCLQKDKRGWEQGGRME